MDKVYQEEEDSTFNSNGKTYNLNQIFKLVHKEPIKYVAVSDLVWVLKHCKPNPKRVAEADIHAPILVTEDEGRQLVVDGLHRLQKAVNKKISYLPSRYVSEEVLNRCRVKNSNMPDAFKKW